VYVDERVRFGHGGSRIPPADNGALPGVVREDLHDDPPSLMDSSSSLGFDMLSGRPVPATPTVATQPTRHLFRRLPPLHSWLERSRAGSPGSTPLRPNGGSARVVVGRRHPPETLFFNVRPIRHARPSDELRVQQASSGAPTGAGRSASSVGRHRVLGFSPRRCRMDAAETRRPQRVVAAGRQPARLLLLRDLRRGRLRRFPRRLDAPTRPPQTGHVATGGVLPSPCALDTLARPSLADAATPLQISSSSTSSKTTCGAPAAV